MYKEYIVCNSVRVPRNLDGTLSQRAAMASLLDSADLQGGLLWFQLAYSVWQFVRVAKFFRLPYAFLAHTFMWLVGQWSCPFASRTYIMLGRGKVNFYVMASDQGGILERRGSTVVEDLALPVGHLRCLHIKAAKYQLCGTRSAIQNNFVWNYLRDSPDCFAVSCDMLWPGFAILDRISVSEGLKMICQGDSVPQTRKTRFLAVPDRGAELNPNFMRVISIIPLMAQAKGYNSLSLWVSVIIIAIDLLSLLFNRLWAGLKNLLVYLFKIAMVKSKLPPSTREQVCVFFSTVSKRLMFSDQVRLNFVLVKQGEMVYTKSTFNLAHFERIEVPHFEVVRKQPRPYSEEEFGVFRDTSGKPHFFPDGTPVRTYYVDDSRIDVIFHESGGFYNYINNVALHLGVWNPQHSCDDLLDLLHIMEQMQMMPFVDTGEDQFQSLHYNLHFSHGSSPRELTFLIAKKDFIIGG